MQVDVATTISIAAVTAGLSAAAPSSRLARGEEGKLGQAVLNLIADALDANGRRSPVRVRALVESWQRPEVRVEITDDGEGVAEEHATKLFTPFFTTCATGTGLGVALVKRIAEAHGGSVQHQRPEAGGASFVMRVPLDPPADR